MGYPPKLLCLRIWQIMGAQRSLLVQTRAPIIRQFVRRYVLEIFGSTVIYAVLCPSKPVRLTTYWYSVKRNGSLVSCDPWRCERFPRRAYALGFPGHTICRSVLPARSADLSLTSHYYYGFTLLSSGMSYRDSSKIRALVGSDSLVGISTVTTQPTSAGRSVCKLSLATGSGNFHNAFA